MGKHRPVDVRLAEAQAQLAALMARASKSQVSDDPRIQEIDKKVKGIQTLMLKYNRWAAEGKSKVENFEQRAQLWRERMEIAEEKRREANAEIDILKTQRKQLALELANEMQAGQ